MDLLGGIGQFLLVTGLAFVFMVVVASHLQFQRMTRALRAAEEEKPPMDAFELEVAHRLGTAHREPEPFCIFLFKPVSCPGLAPPWNAGPLVQRLETEIRKVVRSADFVMAWKADCIGAVVMAPRSRADIIARRLLHHVRQPPPGAKPILPAGVNLVVGASSHPENGSRVHRLMEAAQAALTAAETTDLTLAPFEAPPERSTQPVEAPRGLLDDLTGVLREDRITLVVSREMARHRRENVPLTLILLDVDHLARYNEHYGRETGDILLKGVAHVIQQGVRETDLIGRMDGDAFLVLMTATIAQAQTAAQRLLNKLRTTPFAAPGGALRTSASIGLAGWPDHAAHPRDLMKAARHALHAAQQRGGARLMIFDPAMKTVAEETPREVDAL